MAETFEGSVYSVTMQLEVVSAAAQIRFPCLLFAQWSTNNHKLCKETGRYAHVSGKADFHETLTLTTEMVYDRKLRSFQKKDSHLQLSLVSKSRPEDPKLVGRCTIDMAEVINKKLFANPTEHHLQFTSVTAKMVISMKLLQKIETDISLSEFDRSYSENVSLRLSTLSESKDRSVSNWEDLSRSSFNKEPGSTIIHETKTP